MHTPQPSDIVTDKGHESSSRQDIDTGSLSIYLSHPSQETLRDECIPAPSGLSEFKDTIPISIISPLQSIHLILVH